MELRKEPPDGYTFGAICSLLDRLYRAQSPDYAEAVLLAAALVQRVVQRLHLGFTD
jgi:hypothetical protein